MAAATLITRAPRWCYALGAFAAAAVIAVFVRILTLQGTADRSLDATVTVMGLATLWVLVRSTSCVLDPPALLQDDDGLILRKGGTQRRWDWRRIESISQVGSGRGAFVKVEWHPHDGEWARSSPLDYPFPLSRSALAERLRRALYAARAAGAGAPIPRLASPAELQAAISRNAIFLGTLVLAAVVFALWVIALAAYPTALISPIDPRWSRYGVMTGLAFGALLPITFAYAAWRTGPGSTSRGQAVKWTAILAAIALPAFALVGDSAGRGVADVLAFRSQPFVTTQSWLRIRGWHQSKSGHSAIVHPYAAGGSVLLPLSLAEYDRLADDRSDHWSNGYCYPVTLDRAGLAVRVHVPSAAPVNDAIRPCTASASDIQ